VLFVVSSATFVHCGEPRRIQLNRFNDDSTSTDGSPQQWKISRETRYWHLATACRQISPLALRHTSQMWRNSALAPTDKEKGQWKPMSRAQWSRQNSRAT
jgi:hypothetical protein